jgi:hypothetical protein
VRLGGDKSWVKNEKLFLAITNNFYTFVAKNK